MLQNLTHYAHTSYTAQPWLFYRRFVAQNPQLAYLCVERDTDLVIEGFPRCGNTFAVVAFLKAQKQPVKIAHHLHVAAQIRRAVRWDIPTLVLIREPLEAVSSLLVRHPERNPARCLIEYDRFYRLVMSVQDRCVISDFNDTVSALGAVTDRLNQRFDTSFAAFRETPENVEGVFAQIERQNLLHEDGNTLQLAKPSAKKELPKKKIKELLTSPKFGPLLDRASDTYRRITQT